MVIAPARRVERYREPSEEEEVPTARLPSEVKTKPSAPVPATAGAVPEKVRFSLSLQSFYLCWIRPQQLRFRLLQLQSLLQQQALQ